MALRIILALVAHFALAASTVAAQESVKRAVFEDCDLALKEFSTLTVEQQMELADFFARIVALNTQSPTAPEAFAAVPGMPAGSDTSGLVAPKGPELVTGALWQSLDAKRELKAKRCALELLRNAGGLALHALPTLVTTYSEQSLSDEIAVGLEETAADVAERAHRQGMTPSAEQCVAIAGHLFGDRPLVARAIVQEFLGVCIPHILNIFSSPQTRPGEVTTYLQDADPSGVLAMRSAVDLAATMPAERLAQIVPLLPLPNNASLTSFINDFIRLAADSAHSDTFLPLLGATCIRLNGFTIDTNQQATLASIPNLLGPGTLTSAETGCLLASAPGASKLLPFLLSKDASHEQQRHGLAILGGAYHSIPSDIRHEVCVRARERALELKPDISEEALVSLKRCSEPRGDNAQCALSLFTVLPSLTDDRSRRDLLYTRLIELLDTTGLGKDKGRFASHIQPALSSPAPTELELILATQIPQLQREAIKRALEIPPSPASVAIMKALAANKVFPKASAQPLIELLRYPEVQIVGEETLRTLGPSIAANIRKAAARTTWGGRASALSALVGLGVATKSETKELAAALATQLGCSFVADHASTLCTIYQRSSNDVLMRGHVESALQRCINEMNSEQLSLVSSCDTSLALSASETVASFVASEGDHTRLASIVDLLAREPTKASLHPRLIVAFLERGTQATLLKLLPSLALHSPLVKELVQTVRVIAERNRDTEEVFLAALKLLAASTDSEYDWTDFIKNAIQSAGKATLRTDILEIISRAPPSAVLAQVIPALESNSPEKLIGGALVGAALGSKAVPIVSRLWHLRESRIPAIRSTAVLALLQINPMTPDIHTEVSRILVNRYFPLALKLPIHWAETAAVVDMDRNSFGDLRRARLESLLRPGRS